MKLRRAQVFTPTVSLIGNPTDGLRRNQGQSEYDDYIRRELQVAFDQVYRGEVSDLDMKSLLAEAHRRHAAR